jgi:flagellar M-ring protein FliF
MPKPSLFVREQKSPSASITVNLAPGRAMDDGQITAIVHLVSSAVAGLPPGNVTVVDQSGRLLTQSNTAGRDLNDAQLKYAADVEGRVQRRIESILAPIVGNGNVHAQVTAQIDFANKEQTEEQYQPNGDASQAVLRSRQTNESEQIGGSYPGGVPVRCLISLPRLMLHRSPHRLRTNKIQQNGQQNQMVSRRPLLPPATRCRATPPVTKRQTTKSIAPFVIPR